MINKEDTLKKFKDIISTSSLTQVELRMATRLLNSTLGLAFDEIGKTFTIHRYNSITTNKNKLLFLSNSLSEPIKNVEMLEEWSGYRDKTEHNEQFMLDHNQLKKMMPYLETFLKEVPKLKELASGQEERYKKEIMEKYTKEGQELIFQLNSKINSIISGLYNWGSVLLSQKIKSQIIDFLGGKSPYVNYPDYRTAMVVGLFESIPTGELMTVSEAINVLKKYTWSVDMPRLIELYGIFKMLESLCENNSCVWYTHPDFSPKI